MNDFIFFCVAVGAVVLILLAIVANHVAITKTGGWSRFVNYLKDTGAAIGVRAVLGAALLIVVVAFFLLPGKAEAAEPAYFSEGWLRLGVDHSFKEQSIQCIEGGANDRITSNIMLGTSAIKYGRTDVALYYRHNSCAVSRDRNSYDALGVAVEVKLW